MHGVAYADAIRSLKSTPQAQMGRKQSWPWRDYLTLEERDFLNEASDAKRHWQALQAQRAAIVNRAIQRAKYAARKLPTPQEPGR